MKPNIKPENPNFSSGPCSKHKGYSIEGLKDTPFGRSHRSKSGKAKLAKVITESKRLLKLPEDYLIGIVPGSDTGAFEMALWSLLGPKGVDVFYWESFGKGWAADIKTQLKLDNVREFSSDYGKLPDLSQANFDNDIVFTWNGTTGGVKVPNGDWISDDRKGLTICDATSAVFAMDIPWNKIDVATYSWQKVLGGEGAHGMLILSPRAVERLETHKPNWPMPKVFRLTKGGKLIKGIFEGSTINTPSMIATEDCLDALAWVDKIGGLETLIERCNNNLKVFEDFVEKHEWINFLAADKNICSNTSICLTVDLPSEKIGEMVALLDKENVAYDCKAYRDAPAGLRFWGGGTIETSDLEKLMPWLEWAYNEVK